jgi:hypothetical protein
MSIPTDAVEPGVYQVSASLTHTGDDGWTRVYEHVRDPQTGEYGSVATMTIAGGQSPVIEIGNVLCLVEEESEELDPTATPEPDATETPTSTPVPTSTPTNTPTNTPTDVPTNTPTNVPTNTPTDVPTNTPTDVPTDTPTDVPTVTPTEVVGICENWTSVAAEDPVRVYANTNVYDITFNGATNNGNGSSTWSYTVDEVSGQELSHWTLELPACVTVTDDGGADDVGNDPTTGVSGIKWDGAGTFEFTIDASECEGSSIEPGTAVAAVKSGAQGMSGRDIVTGPVVCGSEPISFVCTGERVAMTGIGMKVEEYGSLEGRSVTVPSDASWGYLQLGGTRNWDKGGDYTPSSITFTEDGSELSAISSPTQWTNRWTSMPGWTFEMDAKPGSTYAVKTDGSGECLAGNPNCGSEAMVLYYGEQTDQKFTGTWKPYLEFAWGGSSGGNNNMHTANTTLTLPEPLPETQDVYVRIAIMELDEGTRIGVIRARAGGQEATEVILNGPESGDMYQMNIVDLVIEDVPAGTSEVVAEVYSPENLGYSQMANEVESDPLENWRNAIEDRMQDPDTQRDDYYHGDSFFMVGATAWYACALTDAEQTATAEAPTNTPTNTPEPTPTTERVTEDLQVLYTFQEGSGSSVVDRAEVGNALNLSLNSGYTWGDGYLTLNNARIESGSKANAIRNAAKQSDEVTIEAWVRSNDANQDGPARIFTMSGDTGSGRNFTLSQGLWGSQPADQFNMRLRNSGSDYESMETGAGTLSTSSVQHVVFTYNNGAATFYIDGTEVASKDMGGNLDGWSNYYLTLGNEYNDNSGDRIWNGDVYLVAVYTKALSAAEVQTNYNAGATYTK